MEFLSEDLVQVPASLEELYFTQPGLFSGLAPIQETAFVSAGPNLVNADPSVYNNIIDGQAIMEQVGQNLAGLGGELPELGTSRLEDTTGIFSGIFEGMGRSDLLEANGELMQRISELAAEGRSIAPADLELATLNREDAETFVNAINEYNAQLGQEEIVDPNQDDLPEDTISGGQQEGEEEEQEGLLDRLGNWWEGVLNNIGSGSGGSTPPTLPGSSGVIISPGSAGMSWPDIIANPGAWQVYLPGVIPGLPQSPTIIGTIEDILNSPEEVLGDLWDELQNTVENPGELLEDLLNGVVDDDGLITIGGISTVVGTIYDDLFGDDDTTTTPGGVDNTQDTVPGGAEEEDLSLTDDGPVKGDSFRQAPISDEPQQPEVGGGGEDDSTGGGGGGGLLSSSEPHKGGISYSLPQGEMIQYSPPQTANEILTDFTNGLALQRKKGMLV